MNTELIEATKKKKKISLELKCNIRSMAHSDKIEKFKGEKGSISFPVKIAKVI